jgi:hypothetical protein
LSGFPVARTNIREESLAAKFIIVRLLLKGVFE